MLSGEMIEVLNMETMSRGHRNDMFRGNVFALRVQVVREMRSWHAAFRDVNRKKCLLRRC